MSKITIIEGNSNDKDNVRVIMVKGEKGYSAYDLYVQNGGTLTEEQWLDAFLNAENFYTKGEVDTKNNEQDNAISDEVTARTNADNGLQAQLNLINSEKTVFVGDSYALGVNPDSDVLTPWCDITANLMGLSSNDYDIVAEAGSGFLREGIYLHTFLTKLQSVINNITNKDLVKNVIVCGGYNDNTYSINDIKNAISNFVSYCNTQFPNATVFIGCIGYRYEINSRGATTRYNLASAVYPAYSNNVTASYSNAKYVYLNGVENILKSIPKTYMYVDNAHPNQLGQNMLGRGIYQAWKTGNVKSYSSNTMEISNDNASSVSSTINVKHGDNQLQIAITSISLKFATNTLSLTAQGGMQTIAQYSVNNFIGGVVKEYNAISCIAVIKDYSIGRHTVPATLIFDTDGNLKLQTWNTNDSGSSQSFTNVEEILILRCCLSIPELFS